MLAGTVEALVDSIGITECCWCFHHRKGVVVLGLFYTILSGLAFAATLLWGYSVRHACYGPIAVPEDKECTANLNESDNAYQLEKELIKINDFMLDMKVSFVAFLVFCCCWYSVCLLSALLLSLGAAISKKLPLIPWLVLVKVRIICLFILTCFIIFLEGRLYTVGSTVFGLFAIVSLMVAALEAYFWIVVQSLYLRLESREFTMYDLKASESIPAVNVHSSSSYNHNSSSNLRSRKNAVRTFEVGDLGRVNPAFDRGGSFRSRKEDDRSLYEVIVLDPAKLQSTLNTETDSSTPRRRLAEYGGARPKTRRNRTASEFSTEDLGMTRLSSTSDLKRQTSTADRQRSSGYGSLGGQMNTAERQDSGGIGGHQLSVSVVVEPVPKLEKDDKAVGGDENVIEISHL